MGEELGDLGPDVPVSELNCPVMGTVDFGLGPVEVRCTRTEEHVEHLCIVELVSSPGDPDMN